MSPILFALLALAQAPADPQPEAPASRPAQPAQLLPGGTGADASARVTIIYEMDETLLRGQESWSIHNESGRQIEASALHFAFPGAVKRLALDQGTKGFLLGNNEITAQTPLLNEQRELTVSYGIELSGSKLHVVRPSPVNIEAGRLILEQVDGLKVEANVPFSSRTTNLNGIEFAIYDFGSLPAGASLDFRISGLPAKTTLPRDIAVVICLGLLGWTLYILVNKQVLRAQAATPLGALSAQARRDQIVKAIELLERDRKAELIKDKRYQRRQSELMQELATVLREIELARALSGPGA